jgi:holo-[acyl-carrier protein] synthase
MRVIGVGLDATDIPRIERVCSRFGNRFLHRIFTKHEIEYCQKRRNPIPHLAGRFSAKEATMKALGTGHSHGVLWQDIEVVRQGGAPRIRLHAGAAKHAERLGVNDILLTITHSDTLALAQVLLLGP